MILGFPRAKQGLCHTKHGEAGGIILLALLTVFLVIYEQEHVHGVRLERNFKRVITEHHIRWRRFLQKAKCHLFIFFMPYRSLLLCDSGHGDSGKGIQGPPHTTRLLPVWPHRGKCYHLRTVLGLPPAHPSCVEICRDTEFSIKTV